MRGTGLRLERLASFDDARPEWDALAEASSNLFATPEWLETWWRHFGGGHELLLTAAREPSGRLVAILPLYRARLRGLRVLRFLGHGPGDQLGPVYAPADEAAAHEALRLALGGGGWHVFLGEQLLGEGGWPAALGASVIRTTGFPTLRYEHATWDELLASRSGHYRRNLRQRQRRLEQAHEVRYRLADDPERIEADMSALFDLHARRWTGYRSPFVGPEREAFHRDFTRTALERGWLRLWLLELDGRPAAAWYGFRYAAAEYFYQGGRDPDCERLAVGQLLLVHSIRAALEDGVPEYRFLRGDEAYKYGFANVDPRLEIVARGRGRLGTAVLRVAAAAYRSERLRELARTALRS